MKCLVAVSFAILAGALARPAMAGTLYATTTATDITATSVTLNGLYQTTDGGANSLIFNYGLTAANGSSTSPTFVNFNGAQYLYDAVLTNLQPDTTYYFQFNGGRDTTGRTTNYGSELSFTTLAAPAVTPEPASIVLEGSGAALLGLSRLLRRRKAQ